MKPIPIIMSSNADKIHEIQQICGIHFESKSIEIDEIQSLSVSEVALAKAQSAYKSVKKPVIVDDTGLSIDILNGLPGALVTWFIKSVGPDGIIRMMNDTIDRKAYVSTAIGYADSNGAKVFIGTIEGEIATEPRGINGFGYDSIFIPKGQYLTYAEMSNTQKSQNSMRALAIRKLKQFLDLDI